MSDSAVSRQTWIDALRLMAGLSMVGLHATADATGQPFVAFQPDERIGVMLLRAVLYTARTELFLMISVFLLMQSLIQRPRGYAAVISEQARRMLIPFVFWTVFYAFYGLWKASVFGYATPMLADLSDVWSWAGFFLLGDVKYHMHFIPTLFGMLLMYPLFRSAYKYPVLGLLILLCLCVKREVDAFLFSEFWGEEWLGYAVRSVKILTYAGYGIVASALLGVWHRSQPQDRMTYLLPIIFSGILLFLIKLIFSYKTIQLGKWPFEYTPGYWADFLMPVLLFGLCMVLGHLRWPHVLSVLAPFSFGVYLCHPIFLDQAEMLLAAHNWPPFSQVSFKIVHTVPLTSFFVWMLSKSSAFAWTIGLGKLPKFSAIFQRAPVQATSNRKLK